MTVSRNYGAELDALKTEIRELQRIVAGIAGSPQGSGKTPPVTDDLSGELGGLYYSGHYRSGHRHIRWEPQERRVGRLLDADGEKTAKVLSALGHKQRIDILRSILEEPLTGAEIVERLNMGTTGQLYHHIKALQSADLLVQEERGGKYALPPHRALPVLLLLAAAADLLDTSDYMSMSEVRNDAGVYLGKDSVEYDPHLLLQSVMENCILEHRAGYCSRIGIFLHTDGSITVADNGRGIPVEALSASERPPVQAVFTDFSRYNTSASVDAPGSEKGITIPVVNALSRLLSVEVRRGGKAYRQDYKHGIPQTGLHTIGITDETGTSVTFLPDDSIFGSGFDEAAIAKHISAVAAAYEGLHIQFHKETA